MPSNAQSEASRQNGKKSNGPVTAAGKRKSSRNGLRHGIFASTIALEGESRSQCLSLIKALADYYNPEGPVEQILIEKMAAAHWRQTRLWNFERETFAREAAKVRESSGVESPVAVDALAHPAVATAAINQYEMRYDRQFLRALRSLEKLKSRKANLGND
jgi:hypothetical protein